MQTIYDYVYTFFERALYGLYIVSILFCKRLHPVDRESSHYVFYSDNGEIKHFIMRRMVPACTRFSS